MSLNGYNPYTYSSGFKQKEHHHMVLTVSGTWHTLYLDGVQVQQNNSAGDFFSSYPMIGNTVIGANKALTNAFKGTIDDVRVYNYSISPTQISSLYFNKNLVVDYPFNTVVNSLTPNNANLTYDASLIGQPNVASNTLVLQNSTTAAASQYIRTNLNNINLNTASGLTISCWINTNSVNNSIQRIFDIPLSNGIKGLGVDISGTNMIYSGWTQPPAYYLYYMFDISSNNSSPDNFYGYKANTAFYGGATISTSEKKYGTGSLKLNSTGSSYFKLPDFTTNSNSAMTISWWGNYSDYINMALFTLNDYAVGYYSAPNNLIFYIDDRDTDNCFFNLSGAYRWHVPKSSIPINTWNHYVLVLYKDVWYFYINKTSVAYINKYGINPNVNYQQNYTYTNNKIGYWDQGLQQAIPGYVDEFRIFNYGLSPSQVTDVYNGTL